MNPHPGAPMISDIDCMEERSQAMAWSNLPAELVIKISDHHESCIDKLRLRCVCSAWRAALRHHTNYHPFVRVIPDYKEDFFLSDSGSTNTDMFLIKRTIFLVSPVHNSNYLNPFIFKTEKIHSNDKFRSLHPFFLKPDDYYLQYFPKEMNLSDIRITELEDEYALCYEPDDYDPLSKGYYYYNRKVVHLSLENGNDYVLLTILRSDDKLAMFRSFDHQWQIIDYMGWCFCDVISFNGVFYAVELCGRTVEVSVGSGDVVPVAGKLEGVEYGDKNYLMQLGNELILVVRIPKDDTDFWYQFHVYKLDRNDCKWVKISFLGDHVFFLGEGSTFRASSSDLNGLDIMGNHICYVDDSSWWIRADCNYIGCYSLRTYDMEAEIDWDLDYHYYSKLFWPVPSWITYSTS